MIANLSGSTLGGGTEYAVEDIKAPTQCQLVATSVLHLRSLAQGSFHQFCYQAVCASSFAQWADWANIDNKSFPHLNPAPLLAAGV